MSIETLRAQIEPHGVTLEEISSITGKARSTLIDWSEKQPILINCAIKAVKYERIQNKITEFSDEFNIKFNELMEIINETRLN
ncbi:hypothetical protein [Photobacterium damselae]|uniref:hypothetical protein n=1 Tax=Photobacterium damselae TaxID=38293 RepID=UPI001F1D3521|nr:hypothetical protein [Photobacterium damselae]UKA12895.1 hypothetical protein IHC91_21485 [Photobacterium damselae subsp. damselae]